MRGQFQAIQNNFDIRVAAFGRKPHSSADRDWRRSAEPPLRPAEVSEVVKVYHIDVPPLQQAPQRQING